MATSSRANPSRPISKREFLIGITLVVVAVLALVSGFIAFLIYGSKNNDPRFHLDSVSVDVVNTTAARWDIAFSLDKSVGDLGVWVRFMGRDYRADSVGIAGNRTVSVTTTTTIPSFDFSGGRLMLDQVLFRSNNYNYDVLEAACKDVTLVVVPGFSSSNRNSTNRLVMDGGPRLCPELDPR